MNEDCRFCSWWYQYRCHYHRINREVDEYLCEYFLNYPQEGHDIFWTIVKQWRVKRDKDREDEHR